MKNALLWSRVVYTCMPVRFKKINAQCGKCKDCPGKIGVFINILERLGLRLREVDYEMSDTTYIFPLWVGSKSL